MPTQILVEFEPKDASPLEVINTLNKIMEQNLEEGKITDYSLAQQFEQSSTDIFNIVLVAKTEEKQTPQQENPT